MPSHKRPHELSDILLKNWLNNSTQLLFCWSRSARPLILPQRFLLSSIHFSLWERSLPTCSHHALGEVHCRVSDGAYYRRNFFCQPVVSDIRNNHCKPIFYVKTNYPVSINMIVVVYYIKVGKICGGEALPVQQRAYWKPAELIRWYVRAHHRVHQGCCKISPAFLYLSHCTG